MYLAKESQFLLLGAVMLSIGITLPRFAPGIPMSVDTASHLYRILFLQSWMSRGIFPFWSPDWYAGSPALVLYPPLGYYMTLSLASLGLDPVLSYKIIDAIFYWLAPITVYLLATELGFSKRESALGALLFSAVPEVIENYLFFDRFPTVISVPFFCLFVIMFHRAVEARSQMSLLGSVVSMSALMLTHHLSALIAGFVALLIVVFAIPKHGLKRPAATLGVAAGGTVGLTAFWFIPFIRSLSVFSGNPFYNRNVSFPFLRFLYFSFDVTSYLLGVAQFVFAAIAVHIVLNRQFGRRLRFNVLMFFLTLIAGMVAFQLGEIVNNKAIGQVVVVLSFVLFLGQFAVDRNLRQKVARADGVILAVAWFILFLWLGLGYYALPPLWIPALGDLWVRTMDVYRIWLYLALPMVALAALGLLRSMSRLLSWRKWAAIALVALASASIIAGVAVKVNYDLTANVNHVLPYSTTNSEIPPAILNYFRNDPSQGRILGINVPFWIYVLPVYVNKPIIDGWYPQSKLVIPLKDINDYRLDDLETADNWTQRMNRWKYLIDHSQLLAITWVIIGNRTLAQALMRNEAFTQQAVVPYGQTELVVFKANQVPSLIEMLDPEEAEPVLTEPNPDTIVLKFESPSHGGSVVVKEAFFPTWVADADGKAINVSEQPGTGYILLQVPAGTRQVTLRQRTDTTVWNAVSLVTLVLVIVGGFTLHLRRAKKGQ